jgi:hypothetical protein
MKKIFLALVLTLVSTAALAQPPVLGHNGSIMALNVDQRTGAFTIVYAQPKPSLLAIGVVAGTLLISGQMNPPNVVQAVAHVYDRICGAVPLSYSRRT